MYAAVDVHDLASGCGKPVRQQCHACARRWLVIAQVPAEWRLVTPQRLELLGTGDGAHCHRPQWSGGDQVNPDLVLTEVARQIARARLEAGLRHAHPVVSRPGLAGVEVE